MSRGTQIVIKKLVPNTRYQVDIETEDGSSQKSRNVSGNLNTKKTGKRSRFAETCTSIVNPFSINSPLK
jgi:hypothetical protein